MLIYYRDDLLQGTPEGAYRVACPTNAPTIRVGEGALTAEHAADKVLHGKAHADSSAHPNSLYWTCSRAASSSTPNLSTPPRSVSLSPNADAGVRRALVCYAIGHHSPTTTTTGGDYASAREARDLSASDPPGRLQRCVLCLHRKSPCYHHPRKIKFQSTILPT